MPVTINKHREKINCFLCQFLPSCYYTKISYQKMKFLLKIRQKITNIDGFSRKSHKNSNIDFIISGHMSLIQQSNFEIFHSFVVECDKSKPQPH